MKTFRNQKAPTILILLLAVLVLSSFFIFLGENTPTGLLSFATHTDENYMPGFGEIPKGTHIQKLELSTAVSPILTELPDKKPEEKLDPVLAQAIEAVGEAEPGATVPIIIHARSEAELNRVADLVERNGGEIAGTYHIGDLITVNIPVDAIEEILEHDAVDSVWAEREVHALLEGSVPQINAPFAWTAGYDGAGITIAVLDTGIDSSNHMLQGKVLLEQDFTTDNDPVDRHGHGTHVAGTIAGTKATGGSYDGVAPGASLINAKVLDSTGSGSTSEIVAGINWAVDPDNNPGTDDGADIISMSLGGAFSDPNDPMSLAIQDAVDAGVLVVVASGNCGPGCPSASCGSYRGVETPGVAPAALTVGAVDRLDAWACFSSGENVATVGIKPDITAPGVDIVSSSFGATYSTKSGTSMATPHVAGAAALLLQSNPMLTPVQIKSVFESTSIDLGAPGKDILFGSGRIDLQEALTAKLILTTDSLDPISVLQGDVYTHEVTIQNVGGEGIQVTVEIPTWMQTSDVTTKMIEASTEWTFTLTINGVNLPPGTYTGDFRVSALDFEEIKPIHASVFSNTYPSITITNLPGAVYQHDSVTLEISVTDDAGVASVTATGEILDINFTEILELSSTSATTWETTYKETATKGTHAVVVTATDITSNVAEETFYFEVVNVVLTGPEQVDVNTLATYTGTYKNADSNIADITVEFTITDASGTVVSLSSVGPKDIATGQTETFDLSWTPDSVGLYTIIADARRDGVSIDTAGMAITVSVPDVGVVSLFSATPTDAERGTGVTYSLDLSNEGTIPFTARGEFDIQDAAGQVVSVIVTDPVSIAASETQTLSKLETMDLPANTYIVHGIALYGNRAEKSTTTIPITVRGAATGSITANTLPATVSFAQPVTIDITIENSGALPITGEVSIDFIDDTSTVVETVNFDIQEIAATASEIFTKEWDPRIALGIYTVHAKLVYEGNEETQDQALEVTDTAPPTMTDVIFMPSSVQLKPFIITATLADPTGVDSAELTITTPSGSSTATMSLADGTSTAGTWRGTFSETSELGSYAFTITACDSSGICGTSDSYLFETTSCAGNNILVIIEEPKEDNTIPHISETLDTTYCTSTWHHPLSGTPTLTYLQEFDAVFWSRGSVLGETFTEADINLLLEYVRATGNLLLEGDDIVYTVENDEFLNEVLHATLSSDRILVDIMSDGNSQSQGLNLLKFNELHPITEGINPIVTLDETKSPYPDSVDPVNTGFAVSNWDDDSSAIVVSNDVGTTGTKTALLPFNLLGVPTEVQNKLILQSAAWFLEDTSTAADLSVSGLQSTAYLIHNTPTTFEITVENIGAVASTESTIQILVDGVSSTQLVVPTLNVGSGPQVLTVSLTLSEGAHEIVAYVNPTFAFMEQTYLNNRADISVEVAPILPDLEIQSITSTPDDAREDVSTTSTLSVENTGGTTAVTQVELWAGTMRILDGSLTVHPGETQALSITWTPTAGIYELRGVVDSTNIIPEADDADNERIEPYYACDSAEEILLVEDNDADTYSTDEPSSIPAIEGALQHNGYCYTHWDVSSLSAPSVTEMDTYDLIFWSTGDYWNPALSTEDAALLESYTGSLILEGSDIGYDLSGETFMQTIATSTYDYDVVLPAGETCLTLSPHFITRGVDNVCIDSELSPYPDALTPTGAGQSIGTWSGGSAAITAREDTRRTMHFAFSLDAITNSTTLDRLLQRGVEWTLPNTRVLTIQPDGTNFPAGTSVSVLNAADESAAVPVEISKRGTAVFTLPADTYTFHITEYGLVYPVTQDLSVSDKVILEAPSLGIPVLDTIDPVTVFEGQSVSIQLSATDSDNDPLTFGTDATIGSLDTDTGLFTWTTAEGDEGIYEVVFTVTDGTFTVERSWVVTVAAIVEPPVVDYYDSVYDPAIYNSPGGWDAPKGVLAGYGISVPAGTPLIVSYNYKVNGQSFTSDSFIRITIFGEAGIADSLSFRNPTKWWSPERHTIIITPTVDNPIIQFNYVNGVWGVGIRDIRIEREPLAIESATPPIDNVNALTDESYDFSVSTTGAITDPLTYSWVLDGIEVSTAELYTYTPLSVDVGLHTLKVSVSSTESVATHAWTITVSEEEVLNQVHVNDITAYSSSGQYGSPPGTLVEYTLNSMGEGLLEIRYDYSYFAQTNGRNAYIRTYVDDVLVDNFNFQTPRGSWSTSPHVFVTPVGSTIPTVRFTYVNGDWRLGMRNVQLTELDPSSVVGPAPEELIKVWAYAKGVHCSSTAKSHYLEVNGDSTHRITFNPCATFGESFNWVSFEIPTRWLNSGVMNSFKFYDYNSGWTDHDLVLGIDTSTAPDQSQITTDGQQLSGEAMIYLQKADDTTIRADDNVMESTVWLNYKDDHATKLLVYE